MVVRDELATADYFTKIIEKIRSMFIDPISADVNEHLQEEPNLDIATGSLYSLSNQRLRIAWTAYTRGDSIEDVRAEVIGAAEDLGYFNQMMVRHPEFIGGRTSYMSNMKWIIHAILYRLEGDALANILAYIDMRKLSDPLHDSLLHYVRHRELPNPTPTGEGFYANLRQELYDALDAPPEQASKLLHDYIHDWYARNEKDREIGATGIGSHKKMIRYTGYWAWDAAAVVLAADINDTTFANHTHYPTELADWARTQQPNPT